MKKQRIDSLLQDQGFAESPAKAKAMVMAGVVLVNEKRVEKSSEIFEVSAMIRIKEDRTTQEFVGRGGQKLSAALDHFHIRPHGYVCLDIGSSTGGFTDCLLQNGAKRVTAVDSGTNQLVWKLRNDPRVDIRERTNARNLKPEDFPQLFDLIVMDVSFISVTKIIPALIALMKPNGKMIVLIKPQFEVAKNDVGEGGIVRDENKHEEVVGFVNAFAEEKGLVCVGTIPSPILGSKGNREFLSLYERRK